MRAFKHVLAGLLLAIVVAGCMGDDDERRTAALGEGEAASLSWRGDWVAETEYPAGSVITYEGSTFVADTPTAAAEAPDLKCESGCSWSLMAATTGGAQAPTPPPPPKIQVFEYTTGYAGPVELPTPEFVDIHDLLTELPRWQQAVNDWLAGIAPWIVRHRDDNGTIVGEKLLELPGSYLVFARGVFVSAPGLGKTPIPQGSTPTLGSVVSNGITVVNPLNAGGQTMSAINQVAARALVGRGVSDYSLSCTLRANRQPLDSASMSLSERGTASASLMGFMVATADVKFDVGCAHNGSKAGPFVRDLRLVAVKLD